ncbi:unnamed protein product [Ceutorhynchus assimilis]|uniref:Protein FAM177A1 n=1 Tax=Ceutorhynchus assimilis TaxID=467358 RepID=A0A9N9QAL5_9CUCU|nr:unnamed protein product [Ceutorhynchus assimilis]
MVLIRPEDYCDENAPPNVASYKHKTPKRTLTFSDGLLEEYSTDDEDYGDKPTQEIVNPETMTWGPWMMYKTWAAGASTLSYIDYVGEILASLFGITTPRYYFELEEYKRRKASADRLAEQEKGWSETKDHNVIEVPLKNMDRPAKIEEV